MITPSNWTIERQKEQRFAEIGLRRQMLELAQFISLFNATTI